MQAADVYALGVLMWEMAAGQRLWADLSWSQAQAAATLKHARPRTPRHRCTPAGLESLARLCMASDPENRPSFEEVRTSQTALVCWRRQSWRLLCILAASAQPCLEASWQTKRGWFVVGTCRYWHT